MLIRITIEDVSTDTCEELIIEEYEDDSILVSIGVRAVCLTKKDLEKVLRKILA